MVTTFWILAAILTATGLVGMLVPMITGAPILFLEILLGPFVGAVLGVLSLQRILDQAIRAGFGTVVGLALGIAGKLAIGFSMIGLLLIMRFTEP